MYNAPKPQFNIIYADPPWKYQGWTKDGQPKSKYGGVPYPCMKTEDICALPVQDIAAKDCVLFLWAVYPMLPAAFEVITAWGFTYKTVAFTWAKTNPKGNKFPIALGYWTRANPEICLLATKGQPKRVARNIPNLIIAPRREHSRKPDETRERIIAVCGDLPRAELFARQKAAGWSAWGNEVQCDMDLSQPRSNVNT